MQGHHLSGSLLAVIASALVLSACGGAGGDEVAGCDGDQPDDAIRLDFRMVPGPTLGRVDEEEAEPTRQNLCDRAHALGVEDVVVRGEENQVEVFLAGENAERAAELIAEPLRLAFYDWEANVVLDPALTARSPKPTEEPFASEYDAVTFAAAQTVDCSHERCTVPGPIFYLYDLDTKELIEGPTYGAEELLSDRVSGDIDPPIEVQAIRESAVLAQEGPDRFFVLSDRAFVTGDQIENVEATVDPETGEPAISFDLTEEGRKAFEVVTRRMARRGAENNPEVNSAAQAGRSGEHFAITLDGRVLTRPVVNFVEDRQGADGTQRFTVSGGWTEEEAEELAALLEVGPTPVGLALGE